MYLYRFDNILKRRNSTIPTKQSSIFRRCVSLSYPVTSKAFTTSPPLPYRDDDGTTSSEEGPRCDDSRQGASVTVASTWLLPQISYSSKSRTVAQTPAVRMPAAHFTVYSHGSPQPGPSAGKRVLRDQEKSATSLRAPFEYFKDTTRQTTAQTTKKKVIQVS